jgi:hypothetical protein
VCHDWSGQQIIFVRRQHRGIPYVVAGSARSSSDFASSGMKREWQEGQNSFTPAFRISL